MQFWGRLHPTVPSGYLPGLVDMTRQAFPNALHFFAKYVRTETFCSLKVQCLWD